MKTSIIVIARLENNYIREWIEYHKKLGIDKIFLGDNNDINEEYFQEVIDDYISSGFVEIINIRGKKQYQSQFYKETFIRIYKDYDFCFLIDVDEFITLNKKYNNISDFLSNDKFKNCNQIRLCWKLFNDNDLLDVVDNNYNVIKRFTKSLISTKEDAEVKGVINCNNFKEEYLSMINIHGMSDYCGVYKDFISLDCEGEICSSKWHLFEKEPKYTECWLNHYVTKTCGEFIRQKFKRGICEGGSNYRCSPDFFFTLNNKTKEKEDYINNILEKINPED